MKRTDVIKKLEANGWYLKRHGSNHDVYWKDDAKRPVTVKRHREIPDLEAQAIFIQAGLKYPVKEAKA